MCLADQTILGLIGPCERPLAVAEENAFYQSLRKRSTIHDHQAALISGAVIMDGPGKKFFPGTGLPGQQHIDITVCSLGQEVNAAPQLGAFSGDPLQLEGDGFVRFLLLPLLKRSCEKQFYVPDR